MREQLQQYVALLFAGADGCADIQQEILQNTLDRYDDLIAQGKVPEAAYRLAISGIGDINEILGTPQRPPAGSAPAVVQPEPDANAEKKKKMRAIAVALYIMCPIPAILLASLGIYLGEIIGLCILLSMVAAATAILIMYADKNEKNVEENVPPALKNIHNILSTLTLVLYFLISFFTGSWHITWVVFPIAWAVKKLIQAIYDYKEASKHEA